MAFTWQGQLFALALGGATTALLLLACRFRFTREWFNVGTVLGNSLRARAEINYALAHSRWLAMEGERGRSIQSICEDTAMIARRLGFISMRIRFESDETVWKMTDCPKWDSCSKQTRKVADNRTQVGSETCCSYVFRHPLPGQPSCFIELQTPNLNEGAIEPCHQTEPDRQERIRPSKYKIVSEVLAEGWAKSVNDWHRQNKLPIRLAPAAPRKAGVAGFGFKSAAAADVL
jgi:hypothetical protein